MKREKHLKYISFYWDEDYLTVKTFRPMTLPQSMDLVPVERENGLKQISTGQIKLNRVYMKSIVRFIFGLARFPRLKKKI